MTGIMIAIVVFLLETALFVWLLYKRPKEVVFSKGNYHGAIILEETPKTMRYTLEVNIDPNLIEHMPYVVLQVLRKQLEDQSVA